MPLHLTKVAYGASSLEEVRGWFDGRSEEDYLTTRYLPKRHAEIIPHGDSGGGSLYWILKHQLVARSPILRFEDAPDGKTRIIIAPRLIEVHPLPKRAHQGWRYLDDKDAPPDLGAGEVAGDAMPGELAADLARLGLV